MTVMFVLFLWNPQARFMQPIAHTRTMAACEAARPRFERPGRPTTCGAVPDVRHAVVPR